MQTLGKYEIIAELGRGGMGMVFKARDPIIGRDVAIKVISRHIVNDPVVRKRFYREAQSAGGLSHPNITVIHDIGEHEEVPYIVMEFLSGTDLRTLMMQGAGLSLQEKLSIAEQMCQGLHYAHQHDIIHRDIKPDNVRVLDSGRVKVMDFGIARIGSDNSSTLTAADKSIGTPKYMSPEQIEGGNIDRRADIFSFGVVFYELLTGTNPFEGENVGATIYRIMDHDPTPLDIAASPVHADLQHILNKCLAKKKENRYDNFGAVVADIRAAMENLGNEEVELTGIQGRPRRSTDENKKPVALWAALGLLVVLLAAGGGYWFLQGGQDDPSTVPIAQTTTPVDPLPVEIDSSAFVEPPEVLPPEEIEGLEAEALMAAAEQQRDAMLDQKRRADRAGGQDDGAYLLAQDSENEAQAAFDEGTRDGYLTAMQAFAQAMRGYATAADAATRRPPPVVIRQPPAQTPTETPNTTTPVAAATDPPATPPVVEEPDEEEPAVESGLSIRGGSPVQRNTPRVTTASRKPAADRARSNVESAATSVPADLRADARYKLAVDARQVANEAYAAEQYDRAARLYALAQDFYGRAVLRNSSDDALDQGIEDIVTTYQRALERRDIHTIQGLFPRHTQRDLNVWQQYVNEGGTVELYTTTSSFDTRGDEATANMGFQLDFTDVQGNPHRVDLQYRWEFKKITGGWIITEMSPR